MLVLSAFASADIIFHKFLELNSILSLTDFSHKFSFFMDSCSTAQEWP